MTDKAKQLGNSYIAFDGYEPNGLKKREYMLTHMVSSMLTNAGRNGFCFSNPKQIIEQAIGVVDSMLEELTKDMPDWEDEDLKEE